MKTSDDRIMILDNLKKIRAQIDDACSKTARKSSEITLVAVTKTVPVEKIEMVIEAGIQVIGENRVQEAQTKFSKIKNKVQWHLVGHLQTNKVKKALEIFSMIQSVDSLHLAHEIEKRATDISKIIPILIEVNTSQEQSKFGIGSGRLFGLIKDVLAMSHLQLSGLMTLGPGLAVQDKELSRPCFRLLYEIKQKAEIEFGITLPYLSMGMSSDFEVGIEEGSNMIRIGTAIFGVRSN